MRDEDSIFLRLERQFLRRSLCHRTVQIAKAMADKLVWHCLTCASGGCPIPTGTRRSNLRLSRGLFDPSN
jgi:hypothetical protein